MRKLGFYLDGKKTHALLVTREDLQQLKTEIYNEVMAEIQKGNKKKCAIPGTSEQEIAAAALEKTNFTKLVKILLKNYKVLKEACLETMSERERQECDYQESFEWFQTLMKNKDPDALFSEIKKTSNRTWSILTHIEQAFGKYKRICRRGGNFMQRRYDILYSLYLAKKVQTIDELADVYNLHKSTIYREKEIAIESIAKLLYESKEK